MPFHNQSEMPLLYQMSDVFVLPSKGPGETWGLAVNEAMASGCAIIVSDKAGCASDIVKNNVNGFVFHSESAFELGLAMEKCSEKILIDEMKKASKLMIMDWSIEKQATSVEETCINFKNSELANV
jgi:glycosyltransferase involved in cell wall biosynthesis